MVDYCALKQIFQSLIVKKNCPGYPITLGVILVIIMSLITNRNQINVIAFGIKPLDLSFVLKNNLIRSKIERL